MRIPLLLLVLAAPAGAHNSDLRLQAPESLEGLESFAQASRLAAYAPRLEEAHEAAARPADGSKATAEPVQAVDTAPIESTSGASPAPKTGTHVPSITAASPVRTYAAEEPPAEEPPAEDPPPAPPEDGGGGAGDPGAVGGAALFGGLLCAIGFLVGGPIGAVIGLLVGIFLGALFGRLF